MFKNKDICCNIFRVIAIEETPKATTSVVPRKDAP